MATFDSLAERLGQLMDELDDLEDENVRARIVELLDSVDALHRIALARLGEALDEMTLARLRDCDPAVAWLLDAYGIGVDDRAAVEAALDEIRPYIHSHGGRVELLDVSDGVVGLRLAGACSGCTASAITLKEGIERALEERLPGFRGIDVGEDDAAPHAPPGETLLQLGHFGR